MLFSQLFGDLPGTQLGQSRQRLHQAALSRPMRGPMETKNSHDQAQQQQIDHGDGAAAPVQNFFQVRNQRAHQVGKEDGEQKRHQSLPRDVEKSQPQRKQQHRDQNPRRTSIRHRQVATPANSESNSRTATLLIPDHLCIIVGNQHPHQLELVFFIYPKRPGERFAFQVQPQQFALRATNRELLSSYQLHP